MDLTQFAWRDGVLLVAAGIGVYVALTLLRLLQLGKRKRAHLDLANDPPTLFRATPTSFADAAPEAPGVAHQPELPFHFQPPTAATPEPEPQQTLAEPAPSFAEALAASQLEQEVRQLRTEVAALRAELLDLQAARRVSPHYADAMALARRGFDAHGIAEQCGIALGEAELVMALARGGDELQAEDDYVGTESAAGYGLRR